jgi:predicted amidohydrolase
MHLKAAVVQFEPRPGERGYNLEVVERFARKAARAGVQILAFPEMCITGYWHARRLDRSGWSNLAEPVPDGPSAQKLVCLARELGMAIGAGLVEIAADEIFNSYVVALPDGRVHCHRKLHAFESQHVASGNDYTVFDTPWDVKLGILICWDNNLVENVRATALLGADILLAPHQTGGTNSRSPHGMKPVDPLLWDRRFEQPDALRREFRGDKGREWLMRWLPARAHDNGLFVLFANGVGMDDDEVRTGNAMILDPYGRLVAETDALGDDIVIADLDLGLLDRSTGRRWIRGRRPELYGVLTKRWGTELPPLEARFSHEPT